MFRYGSIRLATSDFSPKGAVLRFILLLHLRMTRTGTDLPCVAAAEEQPGGTRARPNASLGGTPFWQAALCRRVVRGSAWQSHVKGRPVGVTGYHGDAAAVRENNCARDEQA